MIKQLDLADDALAARLLDVQRAAYRVEAALIGFAGIPALTETAADVRASGEVFYGYFVGDTLVGVVSYALDGDTLDIGRMVVHPDYFRRGIASALLRCMETVEPAARRIVVTTGAANAPACALYRRHGYTLVEHFTIAGTLRMACFEKRLTSAHS
jgi:ribosomal protein S18 acetylase RimI-like enzyme